MAKNCKIVQNPTKIQKTDFCFPLKHTLPTAPPFLFLSTKTSLPLLAPCGKMLDGGLLSLGKNEKLSKSVKNRRLFDATTPTTDAILRPKSAGSSLAPYFRKYFSRISYSLRVLFSSKSERICSAVSMENFLDFFE